MQQNLVLLLPFVVGAAMGFLYAVSGYGVSGNTTSSLKDNPRITNLVWIATVALTGLIGDWEKLANDTTITKAYVTSAYLTSVLSVALLTIFVIAFIIYVSRKRDLAVDAKRGRMTASQLMSLYVHSGFPAYFAEIQREKEEERKETATVALEAKVRQYRSKGCADLAAAISAQFSAFSSLSTNASDAARNSAVDSLFANMLTVVAQQTMLEREDHDINYMLALPFAENYEKYKDILIFNFDPPESYNHILVLQRYAGRASAQDFGLPVHKMKSKALPGAPAAYADKSAKYVQRDKFDEQFSKLLNPEQRKVILAYFESQPFQSFLSLPIFSQDKIVGVVNVESKQSNFGPDSPQGNLAITLYPFCMLLGTMLGTAQKP